MEREPGAADERPAERLFFIVGRGRSGGTLLSLMLDEHPQVVVAPESLFVMHLDGAYGRRPLDGRRLRGFQQDLWLEDRMKRWTLEPARLAHALERAAVATEYGAWCAEVYAAHAAARGKPEARRIGDKNPHYALFVERLAELFPAAKFVWLVRDYRDNILSYRDVPFDLGSIAGLAVRWRRYNEEIARAALAAPERFVRLRFEDLVGNPGAALGRLCAFLGIDFDPRMLRFRQDADQASRDWHAQLRGPLDPARAEHWRQVMTPGQVRAADAICQPFAADLGYFPGAEPAPGPVALVSLPGLVAGRLFTRLERLLFRLPLRLRTSCIRGYRRLTGNPIR